MDAYDMKMLQGDGENIHAICYFCAMFSSEHNVNPL